MTGENTVYEPPALVELGSFTELTLGSAGWFQDWFNYTFIPMVP
jgi:hypothetical protein